MGERERIPRRYSFPIHCLVSFHLDFIFTINIFNFLPHFLTLRVCILKYKFVTLTEILSESTLLGIFFNKLLYVHKDSENHVQRLTN